MAKASPLVKPETLVRLYMFGESNQRFQLPYYYRLDDTLIAFELEFFIAGTKIGLPGSTNVLAFVFESGET